MKILSLFWRLLRYRVAVMLVLFMLLSAAIHGGLSKHAWELALAALALALSYVSATSSNDLADKDIDAINHPNSAGRPLITGRAQTKDMWIMFAIASVLAIGLAAMINITAGVVIGASILINVLYSLPPTRLSYRTFWAPLILGVAYVGVPYVLAMAVTNTSFAASDLLWGAGLYLMFIGRIILKDFRDRKGDAKYHKPTFLLRYGKAATCSFSLAGLLGGGLIVVWQTHQTAWLALVVAAYIASMLLMLKRLQAAKEGKDEQLSIGVGAKMGNGLLITLLTYYVLQETTATPSFKMLIVLLLTAMFFGNFLSFLRNPEKAVVGYKG